jgi:hypothetical protein
MHKLEVRLKQHTPLIHFQHDQEGATLRASEVKPKLDRFIKGSLKKLNPGIYGKYEKLIALIPDENNKGNSPYKLSIQLENETAIDKYVIGSYIPNRQFDNYKIQGFKILDKTPYFADNKPLKDGLNTADEYKLGLMLKENNFVTLVFRFWDTEWKNLFQEVIPMFFAVTNFGTRQNKGFGCFYPVDSNQKELEKGLMSFSPQAVYRSSQSFNNMKETFKEIDTVYKKLKSGDRRTDGELRKYFNDMRPMIEWEKPFIQQEVSKISGQRVSINKKTDNKQFVRALLGVPEIYEYPKHNSLKVQVKGEEIERYASPLLFKIFNGYIYIIVDSINYSDKILNQKFNFEFKSEGRSYGENLSLYTPKSFDVKNFLQKAMSKQSSWIKL